jgi:hypothetical protein
MPPGFQQAVHDFRVRHLSERETLAALHRGTSVEQILTRSPTDGSICWLSLRPSGDDFAVRLHRVHDEGSADFLDVYEFEPLDEDEDPGEGRLVGRYSDARTALDAAAGAGAQPGRWVNGGVLQDEYVDLRGLTR